MIYNLKILGISWGLFLIFDSEKSGKFSTFFRKIIENIIDFLVKLKNFSDFWSEMIKKIAYFYKKIKNVQ